MENLFFVTPKPKQCPVSNVVSVANVPFKRTNEVNKVNIITS